MKSPEERVEVVTRWRHDQLTYVVVYETPRTGKLREVREFTEDEGKAGVAHYFRLGYVQALADLYVGGSA